MGDLLMKLACILGLGLFLAIAQPSSLAQDEGAKKEPRIVKKILKVEFAVQEIAPPNLVVTVTGQVPTGGYQKAKLVRVRYETPPEDGIQDYILFAVPPAGFATQVISEVKGTDVWKGYTKEAPWLKGIRVHGIDDGVAVRRLTQGKSRRSRPSLRLRFMSMISTPLAGFTAASSACV
jgi:hypothetical protein